MTKATVRQGNSLKTTITSRHHTWVADEPMSAGGDDAGPMATEMLLGALGACVAMTVRFYAQRKGWPLEGVDIDLELERYKKSDYPAYTGESEFVNEFKQRLVFHGPLTEEQKKRLLEIAGKCPVHRLLTQPNFFDDRLAEEAVDDLMPPRL
jgi:putative redox protein